VQSSAADSSNQHRSVADHRWWKRALDFVIYVSIGVALVAAVLLTATYAPNAWWADARIWKALIATAVPFGYALQLLRGSWGRTWFWGAWTAMLAVHIGVYVGALTLMNGLPLGISVLVTGAEGAFVYGVLERVSRAGARRPRE
jgi:hypothetical protein